MKNISRSIELDQSMVLKEISYSSLPPRLSRSSLLDDDHTDDNDEKPLKCSFVSQNLEFYDQSSPTYVS